MLLLLLFSIVIESLLFPVLSICVLFDWSVSLSKKKRLVQLAVLSGWHYQNKSKLIFFVTTTLFSAHPPPSPTSPY